MEMLDHPNIVQLYGVFESKDQLDLVLELATGGQLSDYLLQRRRLGEDEAHPIFQQIVSALEYSHRMNIAHRYISLNLSS